MYIFIYFIYNYKRILHEKMLYLRNRYNGTIQYKKSIPSKCSLLHLHWGLSLYYMAAYPQTLVAWRVYPEPC